MKRLFLLLGSFIFILTGCSDPGTVDYYLSDGYTDLGEVGYGYTYNDVYDETSFLMEKQISDTEKVTIMYDNDQVFVFSGYFTIDGISVVFQTRTTDALTSCYAYGENHKYTHEKLSCTDTVAYYLENAPDLLDELVSLYEDFELSDDIFNTGDATNVEETIAYLKTDRTTVEFYLNNEYTNTGSEGTGYTDMGSEGTGYIEKQINENEVVQIYYENDTIYSVTGNYTTGDVVIS